MGLVGNAYIGQITNTLTITQDNGRVHTGEDDVFWRWSRGNPGVLAFHGATNTAWTLPDDGVWYGVPAAVANAGFTMLAAGYGGDTWGNDTAIARTLEAQSYLQGVMGGTAGQIALLGGSMGGLNAINYARAYPANVACLALIVPVVDLADMHDNNRGGLAASIETAYGGSSGYAAAVGTKNPAVNTSEIAALNIPTRIWYSTSDTVTTTASQTTFGAAVGATMTSLGAIGHSMSSIVPSQVSAFIDTYI